MFYRVVPLQAKKEEQHRSPARFGYTHSRMLQLPRTRDLWVVREAAILELDNNGRERTSALLARLRHYVQHSRWLLHSPKRDADRSTG